MISASQGSDPTSCSPDGGGERIIPPFEQNISTAIDAAEWAANLSDEVHVEERAVICDGLLVATCPTWYAAHEVRNALASTLERLGREYQARVHSMPTSFPLSGGDVDARLHEAEIRDAERRDAAL